MDDVERLGWGRNGKSSEIEEAPAIFSSYSRLQTEQSREAI